MGYEDDIPREAVAGFGKLESVTDPRVVAEGYAVEWEAWARSIRRHPEVVEFGRPGHPEFDAALDAAVELDDGAVAAELDELDADYFADDE